MPGFRRVPDTIRAEVQACASETFVVAASRTLPVREVTGGELAHLGVRTQGAHVVSTASTLPPASQGRWSGYNQVGRIVVRKDLPKVRKQMGGWYAPNFGDPSKGEHYVSIERDVYQKQQLHGKQFPLSVTTQEIDGDRVKVAAHVDRIFTADDVDTPDFLMAISLIRENLGQPHIVPTTQTVDDWLADQIVSWELLPVGAGSERVTLEAIAQRLGATARPDRLAVLTERFEAMENTGYVAVIVGREGFRRYVGYKYKDDLVVLENFDYGNALYVMYSNWEANSSKPRLKLIAEPDGNFDRVRHTAGWQERVVHILRLKGHSVP
jgi:hypothetical protein